MIYRYKLGNTLNIPEECELPLRQVWQARDCLALNYVVRCYMPRHLKALRSLVANTPKPIDFITRKRRLIEMYFDAGWSAPGSNSAILEFDGGRLCLTHKKVREPIPGGDKRAMDIVLEYKLT